MRPGDSGTGAGDPGEQTSQLRRRSGWRFGALAGAGVAVLAVVATFSVWSLRSSPARSSKVEAIQATPRSATPISARAPTPTPQPVASPTTAVAIVPTDPPPQPIPSSVRLTTPPTLDPPVAPAPAPTSTEAPPSVPSQAAAGLRDKYLQPFASSSIWNMPLGAGALYVPAQIERTSAITFDEEYWLVTDASMPKRQFFTNATFGPGRCETAKYEFDIRLPDDFVVPDARDGLTPNAVAAILQPDGRTILQMNPIARCEAGGPLTAGWLQDTVDIYGPGILGAHGGSQLSSIGGSLRLGELTGTAPIRHALKVNLYGHRFLSRASGGFRWPAISADATALGDPNDIDSYAGPLPALRMGSLLALPPSVDISSLGLKTAAAQKLAWTLQNYGAYVVDDTSWNADALDVQRGVADEFRAAYGYSMQVGAGPWYDDIMRLFGALAVVDNNSAASVGGGGAPLQPLAPPIGN